MATVETAVDVVIGQITAFPDRVFAELIFVGPVILLTEGKAVLLEQTGNLEALPELEKCFTFSYGQKRGDSTPSPLPL